MVCVRSLWHPRHHALSRFDPTERFGPNGQLLRETIERYDPATSFQAKGWGFHVDPLFGMPEQYALLLFWGDLAGARAGWTKLLDGHVRATARLQQEDATAK